MMFYILMVAVAGSGDDPAPAMGADIHSAMSYEFCTDIATELNLMEHGLEYTCAPLKEDERA